MSIFEGLNNKSTGKVKYDKSERSRQDFFEMTEEEKLRTIALAIALEDREARLKRQQVNYITALYFQGYQDVSINPETNNVDVYEDSGYSENQFRKDVITNVMALNKSEGEVTTRPGSEKPEDIAASRVGGHVLPVMHSNIEYDRLKTMKNLYKCLFGNSFQYTDYAVDRKYGVIVEPKFKYEDVSIEEMKCPLCGYIEPTGDPLQANLICPQCGTPLAPEETTIPTKVSNGFNERPKGQEVALVCSPLEIDIFPINAKRFADIAALRWKATISEERADHLYPDLQGKGGGSENELATQYLTILGSLSGNAFSEPLSYTQGKRQVLLERIWIKPELFRGDKVLKKKYPDGVRVVLCNSVVVDIEAEDLHKRWTHEVYLVNPHCILGDGMVDALGVQDQINELNTLLITHVRNTTVGHKLYDAGMLDFQKVQNDPATAWIPVNTTMEKDVTKAVHQLAPGQLSGDVGQFLAAKYQAMQDMSGAYNPLTGKGTGGANTPYSKDVFLAEQAVSRHQPSTLYNRPALIEFHRQLLFIARDNWIDERTRAIKDNTGKWSFEKFTGADLAQGQVDIWITDTDFRPQSRADKIQGLEAMVQLAPMLPTMAPKQKIAIEELLGLPPDSNPVNGQISRAYRMIDRIKKGEIVSPFPMADDPMMQIPVFQEFIVSEEGELLAEEQPEIFANVYTYMMTLTQMMMMNQSAGVGMPQPGQGQPPVGAPSPEKPTGKPGGSEQQKAQSPVEDSRKKPVAPVAPPAAGVR